MGKITRVKKSPLALVMQDGAGRVKDDFYTGAAHHFM